MILIKSHNIILDEQKIRKFALNKKTQLPKDYMEFLKKYNGGIPEDNIFSEREINFSIDSFFGVGVESYNDIIIETSQLAGRIPIDSIPIARVEGGDLILLSLNEDRFGKVYLWEHEKELECDLKHNSSLVEIDTTFNNFIESIKKMEEYDVEQESYEVNKVWIDPDFLKEFEEK